MNLSNIDLNLLKNLDVLLSKLSVTKTAEQLCITQPAIGNRLKRLRNMLNDPLLVRTSDGMTPTEKALELQPLVREIIVRTEALLTPDEVFLPKDSQRVFRVMASDYAEATLVPHLVRRLRQE